MLMESLGIKCILDIDLEDIYFLSPVEFVEDFLKKGLGAVSVSAASILNTAKTPPEIPLF